MQQIQLPPLADGETYLGGFVDANGDVTHTILLPGDNGPATWAKQLEWAKSIGGDLLSRVELAVAHEKHRNQFERTWYWSNEPEEAGWAWYQHFSNGFQLCSATDNELRARAVRRLSI
jgi:hypothetical protein